MDRARLLKVMIGVRERRCDALDVALRDALRAQHAAESDAHDARRSLVETLAAQSSERDKLMALTAPGQAFDIDAMTRREHVVAAIGEQVTRRRGEVDEREAALRRCVQELDERRAQRARNRQKIDRLRADFDAWQAERARERDDQQDEEFEEAAAARVCAAASVA